MTTQGQARNFFPALRVFIFGQEVTTDVTSVSVTLNDARAPSTAEIVLTNKGKSSDGFEVEDRYIVTEKDIVAMAAAVPISVRLPNIDPVLASFADRIKEVQQKAINADNLASAQLALQESLFLQQQQLAFIKSKQDEIISATEETINSIRRQIQAGIQRTVLDPVKAQILSVKVGETTKVGASVASDAVGSATLTSTLQQIAGFRGEASRYPMQVGDCIFHSNDPVRIFFRDPRDSSRWFYMFAGYVSDWVDDVDENNQKIVTIRCEDVLRPLRYARITTSPGLIDIQAAATNVDLILRSFFADDFSQLTLIEFITSMVFGFSAAQTLETVALDPESVTGFTSIKLINARGENTRADLPKDGVGLWSVDRSIIFTLGSNLVIGSAANVGATPLLVTQVDDLAVYQAVVDHEVRVTDLSSMALKANGVNPISAQSLQDSSGTVPIDKVIKAIGENPQIYPVDGGRLIFLVPDTLGDLSVLMKDFKGVELQTTWKTRLSKIFDVLERIEFSFYANGRGDLLCEMPLHDFDPEAFGTEAVTFRQLADVLGESRAQTIFDESHSAGPFAPEYQVARRDTIRWQRTFSDEKVRTLAIATWHNIPSLEAGQTGIAAGQKPASRLLEALVPQFGVRAEILPTTVLTANPDAAELYCQFMLNQFNADARMVNVSAVPQLRIMPNRPIKFTERSFIGAMREVHQSITWGERGDMSMDMKLNYIRGWDGNIDKATNKPFYSYLGGFRANPQNYALRLRVAQPDATTALLTPPRLALPGED